MLHLEEDGCLMKAVTVGMERDASLGEDTKVESLALGGYFNVGLKAEQRLRKPSRRQRPPSLGGR